MKEGPSLPEGYQYSDEDLKIPDKMKLPKMPREGAPEQQTQSERGIDRNLFYQPHLIAEQIRKLKKELSSSPGTEGKTEIMEEYQRLKQERMKVMAAILDNSEKFNIDIDEILDTVRERQKVATEDFDEAVRQKNLAFQKQAEDRWQITKDYIKLFEKEFDPDITLDQEDEGLGLKGLKK